MFIWGTVSQLEAKIMENLSDLHLTCKVALASPGFLDDTFKGITQFLSWIVFFFFFLFFNNQLRIFVVLDFSKLNILHH